LPRTLINLLKKNTNEHPWYVMMRNDFPESAPAIGLFHGFRFIMFVNDLDMINDLFVVKNKYFDKEPYTYKLLYPLFGDGIVFSPSTEEWSMRRKAMASAFYKEKLVKFT
jgi:cytochrome P450